MNPLIQLKKATPLFVIALVLACFTLSPQAFAEQVEPPTFTPVHGPAVTVRKCHNLYRNDWRDHIKCGASALLAGRLQDNTTIPVGTGAR